MNEGRLTVLPDERFAALRPVLAARMKEAAELLAGGAFDGFFDATMRAMLAAGFASSGAHEGTLWLLDRERSHLVPRFNNGPHAAAFVGQFRQSLRSGMISMVAATEQPICENEMHANQRRDPALDEKLGLVTCAMLAVPFYFADEMRGVISAVQLRRAGDAAADPAGFSPENLRSLQLTASVLSRLIEHKLLALSLGIEPP